MEPRAPLPERRVAGLDHDDPDRVRNPMIKVDGQWQEVSWDAAFRRCTELLAPVIEKYGIRAVTAYTGNQGSGVVDFRGCDLR